MTLSLIALFVAECESLSLAKIRTILARLVLSFEFEILGENLAWDGQKEFILWEESSFMVRLSARKKVA
jgi:hypothetical protein